MQTKQTEYSKMVKRRRKPLTEEQKAERRERLAKAREAKAPPKYVSVDPAVTVYAALSCTTPSTDTSISCTDPIVLPRSKVVSEPSPLKRTTAGGV